MRPLQIMLPCTFVVLGLGVGTLAPDRFTTSGEGVELAQTQTKENRDGRQDDRQGDRDERQDTRDDCRDAEGAAGADKRDCKQETRQDGTSDG